MKVVIYMMVWVMVVFVIIFKVIDLMLGLCVMSDEEWVGFDFIFYCEVVYMLVD